MTHHFHYHGFSEHGFARGVARVFLVLVLLMLNACSENNASSGQNPSGGEGGAQSGDKQATPVGIVVVAPINIEYTEKLPGRVVSYRVAQIRPQVGGIIQARLFEEGSLVEEGEQLYQIDPARYQADLEMAQANLESANAAVANAEAVVNRYDGLAAKKVLSEQEFDNAKTQLRQAKASVSQAQAAVKNARINLAYTKVYAPISGFIGPSSVTKGALVTQQQQEPLAVIRQLDPVYVDLSQSVGDAQKLKARLLESRINKGDDRGFDVRLFLSTSQSLYPHKGKLDATDLAVDESTGAIRLRSVFPNPDNRLLPGLFVRASIEDLAAHKALVIPQRSVQIGKNGSKHVWVANRDDKAEKRAVTTGLAFDDKWVIDEGLQEGDRVIVEGTMMLQDGAPVTPREYKDNGKKEAKGQQRPAADAGESERSNASLSESGR